MLPLIDSACVSCAGCRALGAMSSSAEHSAGSLTACSIAAAVNGGRLKAATALDEALERIERSNPALNALIGLGPDLARAEATAVDCRIAAGERLPLAGVPVAIKD